MHTQGWQIDKSSLPLLLEACRQSANATPFGSGEVINYSGTSGQSHGSPVDERRKITASSSMDVYCFNREHLDADIDELESELVLSPSSVLKEGVLPSKCLLNVNSIAYLQIYTALSAGISPKALAVKHLRTARSHLESVQSLLSALSLQRSSLSVALSNLDRHRTAKQGGAEAFELFASPLLSSYARLLATYTPAMQLVLKIKILPTLLSSNNSPSNTIGANGSRRMASAGSPAVETSILHQRSTSTPIKSASPTATTTLKDRFLGDYVSREKFDTVYNGCLKTYEGMQAAFTQLNALLAGVAEGGEELLMEFAAGNLDDLEDCEKDSLEACNRVEDVVSDVERGISPLFSSRTQSLILGCLAPDKDAEADTFAELAVLETESRERLLYLVARKVSLHYS